MDGAGPNWPNPRWSVKNNCGSCARAIDAAKKTEHQKSFTPLLVRETMDFL
jgi:hypothetical protein